MKKFVLIVSNQCYIFNAESREKAVLHIQEISSDEEFILLEIEGVNIQHEIMFDLTKKFKEMFIKEAEKNGIPKP